MIRWVAFLKRKVEMEREAYVFSLHKIIVHEIIFDIYFSTVKVGKLKGYSENATRTAKNPSHCHTVPDIVIIIWAAFNCHGIR